MKRVEEIHWMRFYGAMAVFTFHLIDRVELHYLEHTYLDMLRIPTVLGTPVFIFISVFLFSARYGDETPNDFLVTRFKYVMIPYFTYGLLYATGDYLHPAQAGAERGSYPDQLVEYLVFAGWHGYFLVVAMQFYVIYWACVRFRLKRWLPPGPSLLIASLVGMAWWGWFRWTGTEAPGYLHWIAPPGWLYLFFLALLMVRYYPDIRAQVWLRRLSHPGWLVALVLGIMWLTLEGRLEYSSKESWVVPLFVLALIWALPRLRRLEAPPLIRKVNQASFGIYLAHPMFFSMVDLIVHKIAIPLWLYVITLAVVGMGGSILLNMIVNRADLASALFGKRLRPA